MGKPSFEIITKENKLTHSQRNSFMEYLASIGYPKGVWLLLPMDRMTKYFMEWLEEETFPQRGG